MKLNDNIFSDDVKKDASRSGFGRGLLKAGQKNKDVVGVCADLIGSVKMDALQKEFPERVFEVGVAEQNLATVGSGLAMAQKIPFISSFAMFSPGRCWEQIRNAICYNDVNVKIASTHAGLSVGPDGATHQALEDIGIMRVIPNIKIIVPCDALEAEKATIAAAEFIGPAYLRFTRDKFPVITTDDTPFEVGKAATFREGSDIAIIACGPMVFQALSAAKKLKDEISVAVLNCHTIKPLDKDAIISIAKQTNAVVTLEEHQINCGLGSAVCELLSEEYPVPVKRIGVNDSFGESGETAELWKKHGLDVDSICDTVREMVKKK